MPTGTSSPRVFGRLILDFGLIGERCYQAAIPISPVSREVAVGSSRLSKKPVPKRKAMQLANIERRAPMVGTVIAVLVVVAIVLVLLKVAVAGGILGLIAIVLLILLLLGRI
jgi:hypothetical protein